MPRERLPDRRLSWTQKVRIDNHSFFLTCGEYPDGRLGEVFLESSKEGTFSRGVLSALARMVSIALQSGVSVAEIVHSLKHLNFPPNGAVEGSANVVGCCSVADWISQEIAAAYLPKPPQEPGKE